jgi:hypothetical protein
VAVDRDKVDELTLALMYLTSFEERGIARSWKGYDWDVLRRLYEKGWISDPVGKAKSVAFTDVGRKRALGLFSEHFGVPEGGDGPQSKVSAGLCECGCGEEAQSGGFRTGHDQKLRIDLEARVGGILALRELIQAIEAYASGRSDLEELGRAVRGTYWEKE